jgi:DNA-binding NtrC family response regulator
MKNEMDGIVQHLLAGGIFLEEAIEVLEQNMISAALERSGGNQSAASKILGIHRNTLQRKIVQYHLANGRRPARRKPAGRETPPRRRRKNIA